MRPSYPRLFLYGAALLALALPMRALAAPPAGLEARALAAARAPFERAAAFREHLRTGVPFRAFEDAAALDPADDALWSGGFGLPEFDAEVSALTEYRGELIAAGFFRQAGGVPALRIARWNGQRWAPLGAGLPVEPLALAVVGDRLYAGGIDADGDLSLRDMIFEWDGVSWTNITANLYEGYVEALASYQGELVAGGQLLRDEELGVQKNVMRWDGTAWSPVGDPPHTAVNALVSNGATLYAGGNFEDTYTGPSGQAVVMRFNGALWDTLARADGTNGSPLVATLQVEGGDLYAGGWFAAIGGVPALNVARFHAGGWESLRGGANSMVKTLRHSATGVLVGGYFWEIGGEPTYCVARWTGSNWETFGGGLFYGARSVVEFGGRVVAGGDFDQTGDVAPGGGLPVVSMAQWDGTSWSAMRGTAPIGAGLLGNPNDAVRVLEEVDGSLYVGGAFRFPGDPPYTAPVRGVAKWTDAGWSSIGDQVFSGAVYAIGSYQGDLIVGGNFGMAYQSTGISNIARWTPNGWEPLGAGTNGPVYALAVYQGELYAGGSFGLAGDLLCSGVAHWDGTRWLPAGPSITPITPVVRTLEVFGNELVAGGTFQQIGSLDVSNVARWNGTAWSAMGAGMPGPVLTLETHEGGLFAGAGESGPRLARWDGADWNAVPGGYIGEIWKLRSIGHELYAGGRLLVMDVEPSLSIARWTATDGWSGLGSGVAASVNRVVYGLAEHGGSLYAGGTFTMAGGKSSWHVGRWDGLPLPPPQPLAITPARPNPFEDGTQVTFGLPASGDVVVDVLDLTGRRIRALWNGPMTQGTRTIAWDGRRDDGRSAVPGLYFLRVRAPSGTLTARLAKIGRE